MSVMNGHGRDLKTNDGKSRVIGHGSCVTGPKSKFRKLDTISTSTTS
jgi:hypothetical protein